YCYNLTNSGESLCRIHLGVESKIIVKETKEEKKELVIKMIKNKTEIKNAWHCNNFLFSSVVNSFTGKLEPVIGYDDYDWIEEWLHCCRMDSLFNKKRRQTDFPKALDKIVEHKDKNLLSLDEKFTACLKYRLLALLKYWDRAREFLDILFPNTWQSDVDHIGTIKDT